MTSHLLARAAVFLCAAAVAAPALASQAAPAATLRVVVHDPSGAVIPGASVRVRAAGVPEAPFEAEVVSDGQGQAAVPLRPGRYDVEVRFPGFATQVVSGVRVRGGETRRTVTLALDKIDETLAVGRDPETSASDPAHERFGTVLSREQIDALPDDPDEMERVLTEMAGPGAVIRVDGFRGGRLPPKAQIRSIRFASGMFAAEHHGGGMVFVDIATAPGLGPLQGSMDVTFRDEALNARNAFQQHKAPEQMIQYTATLGGTLVKDRTSFSLAVGGASLYDSAHIFAALADGSRDASAVRRPSDRVNVNGRLDHPLTRAHTLRATIQQHAGDQANLGIGGFDLGDRGFSQSRTEGILRVSESGPWSRTIFAETRLQVRSAETTMASALDAPTIRVLDAFTAGGAQQAGARRARDVEFAANVDWARGRHAVRFGTLVEGGRYTSDLRTNYLGTFTFASLEDFAGGRPSAYSQRLGDPRVAYSHWQAGLFVQDDWRARRNLTLSAGLRQEFQTHLHDRLNLAPRAGFTWSPFKHGRTTIRGGGGRFYDWLEAEVYEQTLRIDGSRQQELNVLDPGYPNPLDAGRSVPLPPSKYVLAAGLLMPERDMVSTGISHQITPSIGFNVNLMHVTGANRFRGRNTNAPLAGGARPDPAFGHIVEVESSARMRSRMVHAGMNVNVPARRIFLFANYSFIDQRNDADGPFTLPADSYALAAEWGPALGVPRHAASAVLNMPLVAGVRLGLSATARAGTPYNVTTGRDDNRDAVFTDRPAGVGRNSARGRGAWDVAARLSYAFGFGDRGSGPDGGPTMIVQRIGGGGLSAGDLLGGGPGGTGAEQKRIRIELFVAAQNLLNQVTPTGYSGVMTSPFFGQPTAAMPGRRIDGGIRVAF